MTVTKPLPAAQPTARPLRIPRPLAVALAIAAPIAPLAIGLGDVLTPYRDAGDARGVLDAFAAHPAVVDVLLWLPLLITLTLIPGVLAAGLAALSGAPRLAGAGLIIGVPCWAVGLLIPGPDSSARALLDAGVPRAEAARLLDVVAAHPAPVVGVALALFVVGHILGTVLLGLALWRARAVPAVIAWALVVSMPLHFVAFVVLGIPVLSAAAYWLTALGFGAAGLRLARRAPEITAA